MPFLESKGLVLVKIEATEGTDPIPTAAANSILVSSPNVNCNHEEIERDLVLPHLSDTGMVVGVRYAQVTFTTELRNAGTAGTLNREVALWQACGCSPQTSAGSIVIKPYSNGCTATALFTATIYTYLDGILHALRGCRGNAELQLEVGKFGRVNWTFTGVYTALTAGMAGTEGIRDAAIPAPTWEAYGLFPPAILNAGFTHHAAPAAAKIASVFSINLNNVVQTRPDFNSENGVASVAITDRKISGTMNPEATTRASHDLWFKHQSGARGAVQITAGATAGNIVVIDGPLVQYGTPVWAARNGFRVLDVPLRFTSIADAGDDEIAITFK